MHVSKTAAALARLMGGPALDVRCNMYVVMYVCVTARHHCSCLDPAFQTSITSRSPERSSPGPHADPSKAGSSAADKYRSFVPPKLAAILPTA
jgi:hypothetical protein